ncbi:hypothetical protein M0R45_007066 [Rubus argutus]|uniref:Uncharacterized protein n=1 Tax=Rubus argutus TaxID=59490 RepID=A0AAW1YSR6_RUBAR
MRLIGTEGTGMRLLTHGYPGYRHETFCSWVPRGTVKRLMLMSTERYLHEAHGYPRHEAFGLWVPRGTFMRLMGTEGTGMRLLTHEYREYRHEALTHGYL